MQEGLSSARATLRVLADGQGEQRKAGQVDGVSERAVDKLGDHETGEAGQGDNCGSAGVDHPPEHDHVCKGSSQQSPARPLDQFPQGGLLQ